MARAARRTAAVIVLLVVGLLSVTALVAAGLLLPIPRPDLCATLVAVALDGVARGCGDVARASAAPYAVGFARGCCGADVVKEPAGFFDKFQRWGPGAALPPTPDPRVILGWNQD
jgi:hypothetical protein